LAQALNAAVYVGEFPWSINAPQYADPELATNNYTESNSSTP
jgi:hypothetical protein